jgi:hypothetical protein
LNIANEPSLVFHHPYRMLTAEALETRSALSALVQCLFEGRFSGVSGNSSDERVNGEEADEGDGTRCTSVAASANRGAEQ